MEDAPAFASTGSELERLALSMGVPPAFATWLSDQGLRSPDDLAMVCAKESDVETTLLQASGVSFDRFIERLAVTRLWLHARSRVDREVGVRNGKVQDSADDKLGDEITNDIYAQWLSRHGFRPAVGRVLSDTLFTRRYKELNATPKRLTIILPDQLQTAASLDRRGTRLEHEAIDGHNELWTRIRADLTSMSLVTIREPAFFGFGCCETLSDNIRGWLFQRFDERVAPLGFYVEAYAKTMQVFVEGIRTAGRTLSDLVADTSSYQHFWTVYTPTSASRAAGLRAGATADVSRDLAGEVARLQERLRRQQSDFDRRLAQTSANAADPRGPGRGSNGGGGGGGNSSGGSGGRPGSAGNRPRSRSPARKGGQGNRQRQQARGRSRGNGQR